jgi:formate-nitrite transporter family protein
VLGRQQLFTENTLTVMLPALRRRDPLIVRDVLCLWATVLAANITGTAIFASAIATLPVFEAPVHDALVATARDAIAPPFAAARARDLRGWLVALMVWLVPFAETSRIWAIVAIAYVVGLGQFSHVIAGSVDTLYLVARSEFTVSDYLIRFLVPSLTGNVLRRHVAGSGRR